MAETEPLMDTGLIVGLLNKRDQHHRWAKQQFAQLPVPLHTCEAVLSESFHLLEPVPTGPERLLVMLERGVLDVPFRYAEHASRVHALMRKYADQPMAFADACLVPMAETHAASRVVTTDGDFRVYRTEGGERLGVIAP